MLATVAKGFACAGLSIVLASCGLGAEAPVDTPGVENNPPRFSEHLACSFQVDGAAWQHLYRLDLRRPLGEFVGGQGGAIRTVTSAKMTVSSDQIAMTFEPVHEPQSQGSALSPFRVQVHRGSLAYHWFWQREGRAGETREPDFRGRCLILDGHSLRSGGT